MKRFLITTPIEETWPSDNEPVLFLGEWCKLYRRKERWEQLGTKTASYHWDDRVKLAGDYRYLQKLHEILLHELSQRLNQLHQVDHSVRYWRIVIGPWLGYFTQMLFDRWFMLQLVVEGGLVGTCKIVDRDALSLIPNDMGDFHQLFPNDVWNEAIYGQLLEKYWSDSIEISRIDGSDENPCAVLPYNGWKQSLRSAAIGLINWSNSIVTRESDYFFISSYLPAQFEIALQFRLGQLPQLWRSKSVPKVKPELSWREWRLNGGNSGDTGFERVVREMIPMHLPTLYLEGYKQLVASTIETSWPKQPKAIFTSNAYSADDFFKVWAAEKVESGTPLVIGQHGGNFGMTPFAFYEEQQIKIADRWLSWGWSDTARPNVRPVGNLKGFGRTVGYDPNGGALMVEMTMPRYSYHLYSSPIAGQTLDYLDDQFQFIEALPSGLHNQVMVRLYKNDCGWDQKDRWLDKFPDIQLDDGVKNIRQLIQKCRVFISTYNATTYLESMCWNIPTIFFWNPHHWELKDDATLYFDQLKSVGIFHETPDGAARQMKLVWDDVSGWWESPEVQTARRLFCERFAHIPDEPIKEMLHAMENSHHGIA
nr:LIC12162 family protein [Chlorobium phaeovibrioides]